MTGLIVHHLQFTTQVMTPLELDEHSGSALRGSLYAAIWKRFCTNKPSPTCADCQLHTMCPVSALVAPLREEWTHGRDIPRPYIILPPLGGSRRYDPGDTLVFGITLFGNIINLLPYIMLSIDALESGGLGRPLRDHQGQRGLFKVTRVESRNLLNDTGHSMYEAGKPLVGMPALAMTETDVLAKAATLPKQQVTLHLLTPLRLRDQERLVSHITFRPFIQRLLERLTTLITFYGEDKTDSSYDLPALIKAAEEIRCIEGMSHWQDVGSHSRRQQRFVPIGGLLGQITFVGDLAPFLDLLVWGELIHVGKSCVKGNGWYVIAN